MIILLAESGLTYVLDLQSRLRTKMTEDFNLVNGMREGVLVVQQDEDDVKQNAQQNISDLKIQFQNKAACKIFRRNAKGATLVDEDLAAAIFLPGKLAMKDESLFSCSTNESLCLLDIVKENKRI